MRWILFVFLLSISVLHAQDREYIEIYDLIGQADTLKKKGNNQAAAQLYETAQKALKKFQSDYPKWNENVVMFRLDYIAGKLQSLGLITTATSDTIIAPKTNVLAESSEAIPTISDSKAKETNSARLDPAVSKEITKLQEELLTLQKKRDLLKVAMEQQKFAGNNAVTSTADSTKIGQWDREESELKERLTIAGKEVLKTAPTKEEDVPKLGEQLQQTANSVESSSGSPEKAKSQTAEVKPVKKDKQLPAGSGALVAQAERAFAAQRFEEAEKKYLEVLRQDEKNVHILGNLAATQFKMDHVTDAEKNISRALAINPEDSFGLTLLGIVRFTQGKFDEALDALNRSAKLDPQNPETQNYLGITLDQLGKRIPAEAALRNAIKIQPGYAGAHYNLAVIYASQQPPFIQLARWHYEKALALGHPKNPELERMIAEEK